MQDTFKVVWTSVVVFVLTSITTACTVPAITNLVVSETNGKWGGNAIIF